ncbi:MAG: hypothetical protein HGA33_05155 [Candidatus Moranbacteria bacterium]|nr:hypothetical protein [Candidatus Moranbacteria bacterium]
MKITITAKMKKREEYKIMFWLGVLIFVLSNTYFGWNTTAQSGAERVCDFIWQGLTFLGVVSMTVRSLIVEAFRDTSYDAKITG